MLLAASFRHQIIDRSSSLRHSTNQEDQAWNRHNAHEVTSPFAPDIHPRSNWTGESGQQRIEDERKVLFLSIGSRRMNHEVDELRAKSACPKP